MEIQSNLSHHQPIQACEHLVLWKPDKPIHYQSTPVEDKEWDIDDSMRYAHPMVFGWIDIERPHRDDIPNVCW